LAVKAEIEAENAETTAEESPGTASSGRDPHSPEGENAHPRAPSPRGCHDLLCVLHGLHSQLWGCKSLKINLQAVATVLKHSRSALEWGSLRCSVVYVMFVWIPGFSTMLTIIWGRWCVCVSVSEVSLCSRICERERVAIKELVETTGETSPVFIAGKLMLPPSALDEIRFAVKSVV